MLQSTRFNRNRGVYKCHTFGTLHYRYTTDKNLYFHVKELLGSERLCYDPSELVLTVNKDAGDIFDIVVEEFEAPY